MRLLFALAAMIAISPPVWSQTAYTYEYDALGRLTNATHGSVVNTYAYDAADNRTAASSASNSPPNANNDIYFKTMPGAIWSGYLAVMNNDTDPNLPNDTLTITSVTGSSYASVAGTGTFIYFSGPDGNYSLNYTIKDSQNATDSATVSLYVSSLQ